MSHESMNVNLDEVHEDYYTLLNLPHDAAESQIKDAYRRLSRFYHPDKHQDPVQKKRAETLFTKTKRAYEVLIDPQKRAIYDTLGIKGLETEGWELVQRTKTAQEIREEFERLEKERQERRLHQRTNPHGNIAIQFNISELFAKKEDLDDDEEFDDENVLRSFQLLDSLEVSSMSISQSIDAPLSHKDTVSLRADLHGKNGTGTGLFSLSMRHASSVKSWFEYQLTAGQGPLVGVKWFRSLTEKSYVISNGFLHFSSNGISPGLELVLFRHVTKSLDGYLTWKWGIENSINTTVIWNRQSHSFISRFQLGIPNSFISTTYIKNLSFNDTKLKLSGKLGPFGAIMEYGYETRISPHSIVGSSVVIGSSTGVNVKMKLVRANQVYTFSFFLCEEIMPSPIFYGTVLPIAAFYCVKSLIIDPFNKQEREKELNRAKQENATKLIQRRKEAEATVSLLQEAYQSIMTSETSKNGLIIEKAFYGKDSLVKLIAQNNDSDEASQHTEVFDVHVPLQCLVQESRLTLPNTSKVNLPGFYDPCFGEEKSLWVCYFHRGNLHSIVVNDGEKLQIPSSEHLKPQNSR
ncbi:dnaJ homolog subfamily C member 11 [Brevipalpus obovatus]|uniref:dnaJ homolog subfamily C member 11 n=1 Tax=Brevipalpus obovatus TaxID=246614 RepID=UPI003D9DBFE3